MTTDATDRDELLTIKQLARRCNLCPETLRRQIRAQRFPAPLKIGRASRWHWPTVRRFLGIDA